MTEPGPISSPAKVRIIAPANNESVYDSVRIRIEAFDDKGITKVELYIDGSTDNSKTFSNKPYEYLWHTPQHMDTSIHTIFAKAYDVESNITTTELCTLNVFKFQPPSQLQITSISDEMIKVKWKDNSVAESGYDIEISRGPNNYVFAKGVGPNIDSAEIPGSYSIDSTYYCRITVKLVDRSITSFPVGRTLVFPTPIITNVKFITDTTVQIDWLDNTDFESGFVIEQSDNGGPYSIVKQSNANSTTAVIPGIFLLSKTYSFRIRATTAHNASRYSAVSTKEFNFPAPYGLQITSLGPTSARLEWSDNTTIANRYIIQRKERNGAYQEAAAIQSNNKFYIDDNLDSTKDYIYKVYATTAYNQSSYSGEYTIGYIPSPALATTVHTFTNTYGSNLQPVQASSDGSYFAITTYTGNKLTVFDVATKQERWKITFMNYCIFAISNDNSFIAVRDDAHSIKIMNAYTGALLRTLPDTSMLNVFRGMIFNPDDSKLICSSADSFGGMEGKITCIDVITGKTLFSFSIGQNATGQFSLSVSPDGTTLAVANTQSVQLRNMANGSLKYTFPHTQGEEFVYAKYIANDLLAFKGWSNQGGTIKVFTASTQTLKYSLNGFSFDFSPFISDKKDLFLMNFASKSPTTSAGISLYRLSDGLLVRTWDAADSEPLLLFPIPDQNIIASLNAQPTLKYRTLQYQWDNIGE